MFLHDFEMLSCFCDCPSVAWWWICCARAAALSLGWFMHPHRRAWTTRDRPSVLMSQTLTGMFGPRACYYNLMCRFFQDDIQSSCFKHCLVFKSFFFSSYVLGSGKQIVAAGGAEEQPVTLEYMEVVEEQLAEVIYCCCFSLSLSVFSDMISI